MIRRFKYWLLRVLLNDICRKSNCDTCCLHADNVPLLRWCPCAENEVYKAARQAWKLNIKTYSDILSEEE